MQYIWTEKDIICGRIVCKDPLKNGYKKFTAENTATLTYKLGYAGDGTDAIYVIAMTDGSIGPPKTKAELAFTLTSANFIPMPHKWMLQVMDHLRDCYEGV